MTYTTKTAEPTVSRDDNFNQSNPHPVASSGPVTEPTHTPEYFAANPGFPANPKADFSGHLASVASECENLKMEISRLKGAHPGVDFAKIEAPVERLVASKKAFEAKSRTEVPRIKPVSSSPSESAPRG